MGATPRSCSPPHAHAPTDPPEPTASQHCDCATPTPQSPLPSPTLHRHGPLGHCRSPPDRTAHGATTGTSRYFASEHYSRRTPGTGSLFTTIAGLRQPSSGFPPRSYLSRPLENIYSDRGRHSHQAVVSFLLYRENESRGAGEMNYPQAVPQGRAGSRPKLCTCVWPRQPLESGYRTVQVKSGSSKECSCVRKFNPDPRRPPRRRGSRPLTERSDPFR